MKEEIKFGTYKEKEVKVFLKKLIIFSLIFIALIVFFAIKACSRTTMEEDLFSSSQLYFEKYSSILPKNEGECVEISVNEMISKSIIKNIKDYKECDRENSKVKVCKLKNGNYQYTPIVSCGADKSTEFDEFKDGNESDLINGNTDIKFTYLPMVNTNKVKSYYPKNDGMEYYEKAPNEEYKFRTEEGVQAFKWYKQDTGTNYWNNGAYTSLKPSGYDAKGEEGTPIVKISLEKPTEAEYRTIENKKLYRSKKIEVARILSYVCKDKKLQGQITSPVQCEDRNASSHKITIGKYYTCNGTDKVVQNTVCSNQQWSDYTTNVCTKSPTLDCESVDGYVYTDKVWKWYVSGDFRKYYPSDNASSEEENAYYVDSPGEGYIKDETTEKKVYKYFKLLDEEDETSTLIQISDEYLEIEDLYKSFIEYGFDVTQLNDINTNNEIEYKTKLEIRNRKIGE